MKWLLPALLLLAVAAGVAGGLFYTWVLNPLAVYDSSPAALHAEAKMAYLALIGDLYAGEGDLDRARSRLAALGLEPDGVVLAGLIEHHLAGGGRPEDVRNLAYLASALGASGGVLSVFAGPSPSPRPPAMVTVAEQGPTATPLPTPTPVPIFRLVEQTELCAQPGRPGTLAVFVQDAAGQELSGVEVLVAWVGGQDRFWTGLRPELGSGYADFGMAPATSYDVVLADQRSEMAVGLAADVSADLCPAGVVAVDWRLVYRESP